MRKARLILVGLFVLCFGLAAYLQPRHAARAEAAGQTGNVLVLLLGDGRKLFANQFYAQADAYFHRGSYPSIFDQKAPEEVCHMNNQVSQGEPEHSDGGGEHEHSEHCEHGEPGKPVASKPDWIARFGSRFRPQGHVELADGNEREILPWLRLATELDPHQVTTYAVTAYFLRDRMGKPAEAQAYLRAGLRDNPNHPELLYQLGLCHKQQNDLLRANNLFTAALRRWRETEQAKEEPDLFLLRSILDGLITIAVEQGEIGQAVEYLQQRKAVSPHPESIQKKIDELKAPPVKAVGQ